MANGLLMGILNYNIEVYGLTSRYNINMINKIIVETAKIILKNEAYGITEEKILKKLKWNLFEDKFKIFSSITTYKIINGSDESFLKN